MTSQIGAPEVGWNLKVWGVSPRNMRACNFSKPQRGGTELCAPALCNVRCHPPGFRIVTKRPFLRNSMSVCFVNGLRRVA
jgi:hypothetical protein